MNLLSWFHINKQTHKKNTELYTELKTSADHLPKFLLLRFIFPFLFVGNNFLYMLNKNYFWKKYTNLQFSPWHKKVGELEKPG